MSSLKPTEANQDHDWHNVRIPGAGIVRVGWWDYCWRTVRRPVTPKQAADQGWEYVGLDSLPTDQRNY